MKEAPIEGTRRLLFLLRQPADQPKPSNDRTARTMTTAPTSQMMLFMAASFLSKRFVGDGPGTSGIRPHAKPTRFRIAMTMTIAPTNQTMLFMTSLLVCCGNERRGQRKVPGLR
ncbi:hypothetical protein YH62_12575 [Rhizobium sp. LC145]|nr:hypothetical protein YH62_12575 [Rhizobium sp. LC145]